MLVAVSSTHEHRGNCEAAAGPPAEQTWHKPSSLQGRQLARRDIKGEALFLVLGFVFPHLNFLFRLSQLFLTVNGVQASGFRADFTAGEQGGEPNITASTTAAVCSTSARCSSTAAGCTSVYCQRLPRTIQTAGKCCFKHLKEDCVLRRLCFCCFHW